MLQESIILKVQDYFNQLKDGRIGSGDIFFFEEVETDQRHPRSVIQAYYEEMYNPHEKGSYSFAAESLIAVEEVPNWDTVLWEICERFELVDQQEDIYNVLVDMFRGEEVIAWHIVPREKRDPIASKFADPDTDNDDLDSLIQVENESDEWQDLFFCSNGRYFVVHFGKNI